MTTLKELAMISGISKSTISRVINNDPNVKAETREKVLEYVKKLDYKPNLVARSMVTGNLPLVLVIVGDIQNDYFARIVTGIESVLSEKDYLPVIFSTMYDEEKEKKIFEAVKYFKPAGMIPITGTSSAEFEAILKNTDCKTVLVNKDSAKLRLDEVLVDDFEAGYAATKILIDNGHRCIAHMSGNSERSSISKGREQGYRQALEDTGITVREELIFRGNLAMKSGYSLAEEIFQHKEITAICSNNFLMSMGLIRYGRTIDRHLLKEYELSCCEIVPELYEHERISYAGADLESIGGKAARILLSRIEGSDEPRQKIFYSASKIYNAARYKSLN